MNRARRTMFVATTGLLALVTSLAGPALAASETISASVGPVAIPEVPVEICVGDECQTTPPVDSASIALEAMFDVDAGDPPTITQDECPEGQSGLALVVNTGSASATVSGTVTVSLPDGSTETIPVGPVTVGGSESVTVSVCTTADVPEGPGDPGLPALPGAPELPGAPSLPEDPGLPGVPGLPGLGALLGLLGL